MRARERASERERESEREGVCLCVWSVCEREREQARVGQAGGGGKEAHTQLWRTLEHIRLSGNDSRVGQDGGKEARPNLLLLLLLR